jgi:hypothetical protein
MKREKEKRIADQLTGSTKHCVGEVFVDQMSVDQMSFDQFEGFINQNACQLKICWPNVC